MIKKAKHNLAKISTVDENRIATLDKDAINNSIPYYRDPYAREQFIKERDLGGISLITPLDITSAMEFLNWHYSDLNTALIVVTRKKGKERNAYLCVDIHEELFYDFISIDPIQEKMLIDMFEDEKELWYEDTGFIFLFRNVEDKILFDLSKGFGLFDE